MKMNNQYTDSLGQCGRRVSSSLSSKSEKDGDKIAMKYTKVPFACEEKSYLQEQAKAKGMRLSKYIRECLFNQRSCEIKIDQKLIEEHTKALIGVREDFKEIYHTPIEDKILLTGFFQQMHERMHAMEIAEAKIRRDIREIKIILQEECVDGLKEGESSADISM